jgi:hypothetical protein
MIEVLKLALKALNAGEHAHLIMNTDGIKDKVRQTIAELESQEPVAIVREQFVRIGNKDNFQRRLRIAGLEGNHLTMSSLKVNDKLYAHPPQRTWVGLAKEDRLCAKYMQDAPDGIEAVIDYIEAKLKEKNT